MTNDSSSLHAPTVDAVTPIPIALPHDTPAVVQRVDEETLSSLQRLRALTKRTKPNFENTMDIFSSLAERFSRNLQSTALGAFGAVAPFVAPLFVPGSMLPLVYGGISVVNALVAQRDAASTAGAVGTLAAQALYALGVPFSEWLVAAGAGFFGFFSKDAASGNASSATLTSSIEN